jgi:hypothetical protein
MSFRIKNKTGYAITVTLKSGAILSLIPKEVTGIIEDEEKSESMKYQEKKDDIAFLTGDYKTPDEKAVEKFDTVEKKKPIPRPQSPKSIKEGDKIDSENK